MGLFKSIKEIWRRWCKTGIHFPFAHDPVTNKPSVTLLFPYITFVATLISILFLHLGKTDMMASLVCMAFWVLSTVFYMIRKINKAKFDIDDGSIEVENSEEET